jgi:hypothetical protein
VVLNHEKRLYTGRGVQITLIRYHVLIVEIKQAGFNQHGKAIEIHDICANGMANRTNFNGID